MRPFLHSPWVIAEPTAQERWKAQRWERALLVRLYA